jgi:hypothetical protein
MRDTGKLVLDVIADTAVRSGEEAEVLPAASSAIARRSSQVSPAAA